MWPRSLGIIVRRTSRVRIKGARRLVAIMESNSSVVTSAMGAFLLLYPALHFGMEFSNRQLLFPLVAVFVGGPVLMFRHARSVWLAMDCIFDRAGFAEDGWEEGHADPDSHHQP